MVWSLVEPNWTSVFPDSAYLSNNREVPYFQPSSLRYFRRQTKKFRMVVKQQCNKTFTFQTLTNIKQFLHKYFHQSGNFSNQSSFCNSQTSELLTLALLSHTITNWHTMVKAAVTLLIILVFLEAKIKLECQLLCVSKILNTYKK